MISVCLATYNGSRYIVEQLQSILPQLSADDEVVISDDGSTDQTLALIKSLQDDRIRILDTQSSVGVVLNFERALCGARGEYLFLCDQDDVWLPNKVTLLRQALEHCDLVVSDCIVTDSELRPARNSFFAVRGSAPGILRNIWKNSYLGCCMAFRRRVLEAALPFPPSVAMHDMWLGLVGNLIGKVIFLPQVTLLYRRHDGNASPDLGASRFGWGRRVRYRLELMLFLVTRSLRLAIRQRPEAARR